MKPILPVLLILCVQLCSWVKTSAAAPPPHPAVGQRYVPVDVRWDAPLYSTSFDDDSLDDWVLEGGKSMKIADGRLVLETTPGGSVRKPTDNHLVCWLRREIPADFLLEFRVCPQDRNRGLNILFFSARGRGGESVFAPQLQPRTGLFGHYTHGDLNNYHASYWAGDRGSAHMRKNHGFALVATGDDLVRSAAQGSFQTVRLHKRGGTIRLMVDDIISVAYDDDGKTHGPVWTHTGWISLRQMAHTVRCDYDDLKIFPLTPSNP